MMSSLVMVIFSFFKSLGIWGAMLSMVIENIGVPLPTEIGYLIAQDLINAQKISFYFALLILTVGHLAGSLVAYSIGRWGDRYLSRKILKSKHIVEVNHRLKSWYKRYGDVTVFLTRFVGYVRPWSSFVAGFAAVPVLPFIIWTTLGSLIFNALCLYLSQIFILIWRRYAVLHFAIVFTGIILFSGLIIYGLVKRLLARQKK